MSDPSSPSIEEELWDILYEFFQPEGQREDVRQLEEALKALVDRTNTQAAVEAQKQILRGFRRRDFVRDDFYEHAVIDRLKALSQEQEEK